MVKIINGEIVADDDPRLTNPKPEVSTSAPPSAPARHPQPGAPPAARGPAPGSSFNFNAPPFRTVGHAPGEQPFLNLPDVEIFGFRLSAYAVLCIAAVGYFYGWKAFLVVTVLYYIYRVNESANTQQPAHRQPAQAQAGHVSDMLSRYLQGPSPPSQRSQQGAAQQPAAHHVQQGGTTTGHGAPNNVAPSSQSSGQHGAANTNGVFSGKGYKLGGK